MEHQYRDQESNQARYASASRRKFQFCRRCGSKIGMQAVHKDTLGEMTDMELSRTWYTNGNTEYLFYPCSLCNPAPNSIIPSEMKLVSGILSVRVWCADNSSIADLQPDYAALAEPEPVLASEDSRKSAGL